MKTANKTILGGHWKRHLALFLHRMLKAALCDELFMQCCHLASRGQFLLLLGSTLSRCARPLSCHRCCRHRAGALPLVVCCYFWSPHLQTHQRSHNLFLQLLRRSAVMLYFLNQPWSSFIIHPQPPLSSLTLRWSNCNFSIWVRPHRKRIHPNNHMFFQTLAEP